MSLFSKKIEHLYFFAAYPIYFWNDFCYNVRKDRAEGFSKCSARLWCLVILSPRKEQQRFCLFEFVKGSYEAIILRISLRIKWSQIKWVCTGIYKKGYYITVMKYCYEYKKVLILKYNFKNDVIIQHPIRKIAAMQLSFCSCGYLAI